MSELIATGGVADLIVGLILLEAAVLALVWRRTGRGIAPADLLPGSIAGLGLALALKASLAGWGTVILVCGLLVALAGHLADIARRWR